MAENLFISKDIGFIKLYRRIFEWEWYTDSNVKSVFLHCLLKANHTQKNWRGIVIERGSFITSYENLSRELNLSIQQIRTAIKKLKITKELTYKSTSQYSIISINNYNLYQDDNNPSNKHITSKQQRNNNQITTTNNDNNEKNEDNEKKYIQIKNFEFVNLTQDEFNKLKELNGEENLIKAISLLDEWLGKQGKTAKQYIGKPHYNHFRKDSWVWEKTNKFVTSSKTNVRNIDYASLARG